MPSKIILPSIRILVESLAIGSGSIGSIITIIDSNIIIDSIIKGDGIIKGGGSNSGSSFDSSSNVYSGDGRGAVGAVSIGVAAPIAPGAK